MDDVPEPTIREPTDAIVLTVKGGNCNRRKYIPMLVDLVRAAAVDPTELIAKQEPLGSAIEAYEAFDRRQPGWLKVALEPARAAA